MYSKAAQRDRSNQHSRAAAGQSAAKRAATDVSFHGGRTARAIGNRGLQHLAQAESRHLQQPRALQDDEEPAPAASDEIRELQGDAGVTTAPDAGAAPADAGSGAAAASASLTISGDSYADGAKSIKKVKYNVSWTGGSKTDYIIVQWVKGFAKDSRGNFLKASLYGKTADINLADYQIDSVDEDPAYWSAGGVRWNYTDEGAGKFSATDQPVSLGTADGKGAQAKLDFKTGVYKSADVPTTTTGSISATPLAPLVPWSYYVTVQGGDKYDH
ncbi:MAG: hypothetical protein WDO73_04415 [Ignavibacteriota bacterium]